MCLKIKQGTTKFTAKKDFYVVKIMTHITDEGCFSPYKSFKYEYGKTYTSPLEVSFSAQVDKGLHSLNASDFADSGWVIYGSSYGGWPTFLGSGFVLCKVPKGAEYFIGSDKDVCSNKLEALFPISMWRENATAVQDSKQIECGNFKDLAKATEKWIKKAGYNTKPS